jgi:hypothetical protein
MAPNLPNEFVDEIRLEIIDEDSYTDEEIWTFARKSIKRVNELIRGDAAITDGTSVWDYSVDGDTVDNDDFWEIIKWSTIVLILDHYMKKMIAEGVGASIGLGSERIDTKSILLTVKSLVKEARSTEKQKILAYNMMHTDGANIDLYERDEV